MKSVIIILILFCVCYYIHYKNKFKIVIMTMYFPIIPHKHSINRYIKWAYIFLNNVQCDIIFYTYVHLKNVLPKSKRIYYNYFYNVTSIDIVKQLKIEKMVRRKLFQIYHSKVAIMYEASKKYHANIYFFNDISTFHYKILEYHKIYPNPAYIKQLFEYSETPIFFTINKYLYSKHYIQGGYFGGKSKAIKYLYINYYTYLSNYYKQNGNININEEDILNLIIPIINDSIVMPNNPYNCSLFNGNLRWFYFINILSGNPKKCVKKIKLNHLNNYI